MSRIVLPKDIIYKTGGFLRVLDLVKNCVVITKTNSEITYINPSFTEVTGYTEEEAMGANPGILRSGYHDEIFYKEMWETIAKDGFWRGQVWNRRKSGAIYPSFLTVSILEDENGDPQGYIGISSDITFLKVSETEEINLAFYDFLTKLPNRLFLENSFKKLMAGSKRAETKGEPAKIAVVFFDLNRFKQVNDTHGHVVGDKLLQQVAERLQKATRDSEMVARYGGDEFIAVLSDISSAKEVDVFCERVQAAMEPNFNIDGLELDMSCSIGTAVYPDDAKTAEELISIADENMYKYKEQWRREQKQA